MTITKQILSGSANGRPFLVSATTQGTGITVHTQSGGGIDEVYVWAANTTAAVATLNLQINDGSIVDPDDYYVKTMAIPPNSPPIPILTGQILNAALEIEAWASVNNAITLTGYVNRIV